MQTGWKKDYTRYKDFFLNVLNAYNNKPNLKIYLELFLSLTTIVAFSIFAINQFIASTALDSSLLAISIILSQTTLVYHGAVSAYHFWLPLAFFL